jgi:hypothetical protein
MHRANPLRAGNWNRVGEKAKLTDYIGELTAGKLPELDGAAAARGAGVLGEAAPTPGLSSIAAGRTRSPLAIPFHERVCERPSK